MKLYRIEYDGDPDYIEAESFGAAIKVWREVIVPRDDIDPEAEPESVTLISDKPVVRAPTPQGGQPIPWAESDRISKDGP